MGCGKVKEKREKRQKKCALEVESVSQEPSEIIMRRGSQSSHRNGGLSYLLGFNLDGRKTLTVSYFTAWRFCCFAVSCIQSSAIPHTVKLLLCHESIRTPRTTLYMLLAPSYDAILGNPTFLMHPVPPCAAYICTDSAVQPSDGMGRVLRVSKSTLDFSS